MALVACWKDKAVSVYIVFLAGAFMRSVGVLGLFYFVFPGLNSLPACLPRPFLFPPVSNHLRLLSVFKPCVSRVLWSVCLSFLVFDAEL